MAPEAATPENPSESEPVWFYEGRNGWWQYDERTNRILETSFENGEEQIEVLIGNSSKYLPKSHKIKIIKNEKKSNI